MCLSPTEQEPPHIFLLMICYRLGSDILSWDTLHLWYIASILKDANVRKYKQSNWNNSKSTIHHCKYMSVRKATSKFRYKLI